MLHCCTATLLRCYTAALLHSTDAAGRGRCEAAPLHYTILLYYYTTTPRPQPSQELPGRLSQAAPLRHQPTLPPLTRLPHPPAHSTHPPYKPSTTLRKHYSTPLPHSTKIHHPTRAGAAWWRGQAAPSPNPREASSGGGTRP